MAAATPCVSKPNDGLLVSNNHFAQGYSDCHRFRSGGLAESQPSIAVPSVVAFRSQRVHERGASVAKRLQSEAEDLSERLRW
jgi:hypothetical protein